MFRGLLLCLACAGTLGVVLGNVDLSKVLDCEDTGPDDIYLDLSNTNLRSIYRRMVSSAKITCLNLAGNHISSIASDAFDGLPELHYLNLAGNRVPTIEFMETKLPKLKTLILDGPFSDTTNSYHTIDNLGYEALRRVVPLSMPELKKLSLQNYHENNHYLLLNWLQSIRIPNLTHLHLSRNGRLGGDIVHILSNMNHLTHLYLDDTIIIDFNTTSLPNLRYLSMDVSSFFGNDDFIIPRDMRNLEYLSLACRWIEVIDSKFFENLRNLRFLNLTGIGIEHFPLEASMNLVNLRNLTLDYNGLRSVPQICERNALRSLSLNGNSIFSVTRTSFRSMAHLSAIYLRWNDLSSIENETFGHLPALRVLDLSYNKIVSLPEHWIAPNNYIAELYLDGNKFVDIDSMSLKSVNGLQRLSIGHNPIATLTILSLVDLPNSTRIDVSRDSSSN